VYVYGGKDEEEEEEKNGDDCKFLKEYISINISSIFHLAPTVCTISK
jgi:hypothetical protein